MASASSPSPVAAAAAAPALPLPSPDPVAALSGHSDRVWCVRWSPCGHFLASAAGDRTVRIWRCSSSDAQPSSHSDADADATPQQLRAVEEGDRAVGGWGAAVVCASVLSGAHSRTVRCVAWAPDGRLLASAGFDGRVVVWRRKGDDDSSSRSDSSGRRGRGGDNDDYDEEDADDAEGDGGGAAESEWEAVCVLEGHEHEVKSVAWSSDGRLLASCSRDKAVWVWERAVEDSRAGGAKGIGQMRGGGGGGGAAVAAADVRLEVAAVCQGHTGDVKWVSFATLRGRPALLSASYDDDIRLWREEEGGEEWESFETLRGHHSTVWMALWANAHHRGGAGGGGGGGGVGVSGGVQEADCIISASDDRTLRVWEQRAAGSEVAATGAGAGTSQAADRGSGGEEAKEEEKAPRAASTEVTVTSQEAEHDRPQPWLCALTIHSPHTRTIFAIDLSAQQSTRSTRTQRALKPHRIASIASVCLCADAVHCCAMMWCGCQSAGVGWGR